MEGVALPPKTTPQTVDRPRGAPSSLWECDVSGGSRTFDPCGPPRKSIEPDLRSIVHPLNGAKHVAAANPA
jgi:hypothetical protein